MISDSSIIAKRKTTGQAGKLWGYGLWGCSAVSFLFPDELSWNVSNPFETNHRRGVSVHNPQKQWTDKSLRWVWVTVAFAQAKQARQKHTPGKQKAFLTCESSIFVGMGGVPFAFPRQSQLFMPVGRRRNPDVNNEPFFFTTTTLTHPSKSLTHGKKAAAKGLQQRLFLSTTIHLPDQPGP